MSIRIGAEREQEKGGAEVRNERKFETFFWKRKDGTMMMTMKMKMKRVVHTKSRNGCTPGLYSATGQQYREGVMSSTWRFYDNQTIMRQ